MVTRKQFKKALKDISSLNSANVKEQHFEALMIIVQYSQRFIEVEKSNKQGHLKVTYKQDLGRGIPIGEFFDKH